MSRATEDALALFDRVSGRAPDGVWSAPGRVNLIGEHTDYNEGFVLPFAIPQRTTAAVALRADDRLRVTSTFAADTVEVSVAALDDLLTGGERPAAVPEWAAYPLGVAGALRQEAGRPRTDLPGAEIAIASDVPVGAGLSSSAAIEGAVASALNDLWRTGLDATALARIGRRAENEAVGAPTGIMDQLASMLGAEDTAIFLDCRTLDVEAVPFALRRAGLSVLVIDTRVTHAHSTGGYRERRASCERGAAAMGVGALRDLSPADLARAESTLDEETFRRVRHIVTENQRVRDTVDRLRAVGPREIGDLLLASHASMRDDFEISVPELDTAVEAAQGAGALGARMTGGGFGGAAIALIDEAATADVSAAVTAAFAAAGFAPPALFPVRPAAGPRRDA